MKPSLLIIGSGWISTHFLTQFATDFSTIHTISKSSPKPNASQSHQFYDIYHPTKIQLPTSDICIITLPFSKSLTQPADYTAGIMQLLNQTTTPFKKIIFTSSTSIYDNNNDQVDESSPTATTNRAIALKDTETYITNQTTTAFILRLSGICGKSRNSYSKMNQSIIQYSNTPMNLIHIDDIISIMATLCKPTYLTSDILNITCTNQPTRESYYQHIATQLNHAMPTFDSKITAHKLVSNKKLIHQYKIPLLFNDPTTFTVDKP